MLYREAVSQRIFELCDKHDYSVNKLAELSATAPSTLRSLLTNKVENPSSYIIYRICKTFKIDIKEFYDSDLFKYQNIED